MTMKAVEAVFYWRYTLTNAKAVYGRFTPAATDYTKDFLQSPANQQTVIDQALGRTGGVASVELTHKWPGGETGGQWRLASDGRGNLSWRPTNSSPFPWRLGNPLTEEGITFQGDRSKTNGPEATAAIETFLALGYDPWLIAVKLVGETGIVYPRAYLGNPPTELARRGVSVLPSFLRNVLQVAGTNVSAGAALPPINNFQARAPELLNQIKEALSRDPNVLLIGPPGTGKTVALEDLREEFLAEADRVHFDPDLWDDNWFERAPDKRRAEPVVFHPSYGYEDFVAGLMPSMENNQFRLTARPGPLVSLAHWATGSTDRKALLIIDEFNRGATAAIFGDTIALLDRDKRSDPSTGATGSTILRPYPREDMKVEDSFRNEISGEDVPRNLSLPMSLYIVAALNSSDRSVTPLDAALRRRFAVIPVPPDYDILANHLGIASIPEGAVFAPSSDDVTTWTVDDAKALVVHLLRSLNARIEFSLSADLLLGHALLWSVGGDTVADVGRSLGRAFDERIAAALRLTFIDQDESLAAILKGGRSDDPPNANGVTSWSPVPPEMQDVASERLKIAQQKGREPLVILRSLKTLL
jgi:5-methylcytosine-specific restriction protein B